MKAEIIIENGQTRLLKPIYLKPTASKRFEIDIPEEDLGASGRSPQTGWQTTHRIERPLSGLVGLLLDAKDRGRNGHGFRCAE